MVLASSVDLDSAAARANLTKLMVVMARAVANFNMSVRTLHEIPIIVFLLPK